MRILQKLWSASPASLSRSISYRIRHALKLTQSPPRWRRIRGGPAGGLEMLLSDEWAVMELGGWDQFIFDALQGSVELAGATIWDIGAHVGYHTLGFAQEVGDKGRVVSFEPNPFNYERLALNLSRNKGVASRVILERFALADQTAEMDLEVSGDVDGAMSSCTHLQKATPPLEPEIYRKFQTVQVPVTTVDNVIAVRADIAPDLLKIDVEGAEHLVLAGAQECLITSRPMILIEVHNITCMFEVMRILVRAQYHCEIIGVEESTKSRCFLMALPSA